MNDLICNQHDIPKEQWRYGLRASADTGCGWVATWNALRLLGCTTDIEELIRYYEWQLPLIHGNAGTSFWMPARCFRHWGFPVEVCFDPRKFDAVLDRSDAAILFYHWRRDWKLGAHFIALHRTGLRITAYNTYRNSKGADDLGLSLRDFATKNGHFGAVLLGIRKK